MLTNKASNSKKQKYYRSSRTSSKNRSSCSTSQTSSALSKPPTFSHSHMQQLAQTHYNHKLSTLKRYIDGISKMGILETSLRNSPNTSFAETSGRRHLALQSENNYYVEKINQLQEDVIRKNKKIEEMEREVKNVEFQRKQFKNQKGSLRKMIQLLNRENRVLKKAMKIPVGTAEEAEKENKKTQA